MYPLMILGGKLKGDLCWSSFLVFARRLKSHNWLVAVTLQQVRIATSGGGGGGMGRVEENMGEGGVQRLWFVIAQIAIYSV